MNCLKSLKDLVNTHAIHVSNLQKLLDTLFYMCSFASLEGHSLHALLMHDVSSSTIGLVSITLQILLCTCTQK